MGSGVEMSLRAVGDLKRYVCCAEELWFYTVGEGGPPKGFEQNSDRIGLGCFLGGENLPWI